MPGIFKIAVFLSVLYFQSICNIKYLFFLFIFASLGEWKGQPGRQYIDFYIHSKKCWVVLTQFWVKYGQTRNVGLKM